MRTESITRLADYDSLVGRMLLGFKFGHRGDLGKAMAELLARRVLRAPWFADVQLIVPVPPHWLHRLQRPVYPAELLAERISRLSDRPLARVLKRTRAGRRQVGASATQRQANVRGLYIPRGHKELTGMRVLLVDDVRTTGATLEECARVLRRAGAARVFGAVCVRRELPAIAQYDRGADASRH